MSVNSPKKGFQTCFLYNSSLWVFDAPLSLKMSASFFLLEVASHLRFYLMEFLYQFWLVFVIPHQLLERSCSQLVFLVLERSCSQLVFLVLERSCSQLVFLVLERSCSQLVFLVVLVVLVFRRLLFYQFNEYRGIGLDELRNDIRRPLLAPSEHRWSGRRRPVGTPRNSRKKVQ